MTFDNTDELYKIARAHPGAKLVVRILTDDSKSLCRLGLKFGAPLVTVPALLAKARELKLDVIGVSFHVGSGCYDTDAYADAVMRARSAFDMGKAAGYDFTLLDVGGGFEDATFEHAAVVLMDSINTYFPVRDNLRIIAEPGRYYVAKAFSLAVNIIARRAPPAAEGDSVETEVDSDQPSVMCKCCVLILHPLVRTVTEKGHAIFRLRERRRVRGVQLHYVRSSNTATVCAILERVFPRTVFGADVCEQCMGSHMRLHRLRLRCYTPATLLTGWRLAGIRVHGSLHSLRGVAVQRIPIQ